METIVKSAESFVLQFTDQLQHLIPHHFIANQQSDFFKNKKENLQPNEMLIICDFAENFSFIVQDAIQSFHWSNDQCTIHPFCLYYRDEENNVKNQSIIVIAESLKHDVVAVHLMQRKLIDFIQTEYAAVENLIFFSDGAASQYKNRKNFHNICQFKSQYNYNVEWHFFATSHGKSACDAIGGSFKREAARTSLRRIGENLITSAEQLFEWAHTRPNSKTKFIFCTNAEYEEESRLLRNRYNNVKTIQGTQSHHSFKPISNRLIEVRRYSADQNNHVVNLTN